MLSKSTQLTQVFFLMLSSSFYFLPGLKTVESSDDTAMRANLTTAEKRIDHLTEVRGGK